MLIGWMDGMGWGERDASFFSPLMTTIKTLLEIENVCSFNCDESPENVDNAKWMEAVLKYR